MPLFFYRKRTLTGVSVVSASGTGTIRRRYLLIIGRTKRTKTIRERCPLAIGKIRRTRTVSGHYPLAIGMTRVPALSVSAVCLHLGGSILAGLLKFEKN